MKAIIIILSIFLVIISYDLGRKGFMNIMIIVQFVEAIRQTFYKFSFMLGHVAVVVRPLIITLIVSLTGMK